ncbi:hypothetical protein DICVIV_02919 [Dictyocaulus viviparus]|uniref:Uncharacterized protein n=1 Tax=Dictyocaulus viviparus TaxID=29172 RepID=A0A0D8Y266_DICVI|nr:hypothetical protein DICVIV_02919 [Dictyocaulus viviparus]
MPISPLKYDPDDPSTFLQSDEKVRVKKRKKERNTVPKSKKEPKSGKSSKLDLREANDLETVNQMASAWGAIQDVLPEENDDVKSRKRSSAIENKGKCRKGQSTTDGNKKCRNTLSKGNINLKYRKDTSMVKKRK